MSQLKRKILEAIVDEDADSRSLRFEAADLVIPVAMVLVMLGALYLV